MIITYNCNGTLKKIDINKVDKKHFPPREPNVTIEETPENLSHMISHVINSLESDCYFKAFEKRRKEEQRKMAEHEKKDREAREWREAHPVAKKSPTEALSSMLRYAGSYICPGCNIRGKLKSVCTQTWCSCHGTGYKLDSLIDGINDVIEENQELKTRIAELEVQANKTKK